jgi:hypothetical protein
MPKAFYSIQDWEFIVWIKEKRFGPRLGVYSLDFKEEVGSKACLTSCTAYLEVPGAVVTP